MRFFLLFASLALAGCASPATAPSPIPSDSPSAIAHVQASVPLGTPADQARQILEKQNYRCKLVPADSSANNGHLDATFAWPPGRMIQTTWRFTLALNDNKVSAINVVITSFGSAGYYQPNVPGANVAPSLVNPKP
jgi:hypothetical protein